MDIHELDTPVAVVDIDKLEGNIHRLQNYLDQHGVANRPHIKTHKIPEMAHMQLAAGASGITVQKLGEAEVMAQAGIRDIFLPYNILGAAKLERLMQLTRRVQISVTADSEVTVRGLSEAARREGTTLPVLVEFDSGIGRCGTQTPQQTADLARIIARSPGLHFGGLMTYPNNTQVDAFIQETVALLDAAGLSVEKISGGGSPCMWEVHQHPQITEHRAGTYIYGDRAMVKSGAMTFEQCAFTIIATVVSRPTANRGILDSGSKTLSSDLQGLDGYGFIVEYPQANIQRLNEEHATVDFSGCASKPAIGERVTIIPNHCCVANNLFNQIIGVRGETVEVVWPVAARGLLQ